MRDFETIIACIYRDVGIMNRIYLKSPIYPRPDLWPLVELLLDAAGIVERLALGIDVYGEAREKTLGVAPSRVRENSDE